MSMATYHQTKFALGCDVTLVIVADCASDDAEAYLNTLWHRIFTFERQFSRFLPESELSQFNRQARIKRTISSDFQAVLTSAKRLAIETGGLYNPFILP